MGMLGTQWYRLPSVLPGFGGGTGTVTTGAAVQILDNAQEPRWAGRRGWDARTGQAPRSFPWCPARTGTRSPPSTTAGTPWHGPHPPHTHCRPLHSCPGQTWHPSVPTWARTGPQRPGPPVPPARPGAATHAGPGRCGGSAERDPPRGLSPSRRSDAVPIPAVEPSCPSTHPLPLAAGPWEQVLPFSGSLPSAGPPPRRLLCREPAGLNGPGDTG